MPTDYEKGFLAGMKYAAIEIKSDLKSGRAGLGFKLPKNSPKPRRKLSDWQKFIKANSSKKKFKFANGKLKLKTMGIAYRKTAAYKRNKKK